MTVRASDQPAGPDLISGVGDFVIYIFFYLVGGEGEDEDGCVCGVVGVCVR